MDRKILVVEDSPTQAERLRLLLEGKGYRVDLAATGREALDIVGSAPPDLIISDVVMPGMDGYAFCRAVKSAEGTRRIPFVLMTERRETLDILRGLEAGADNFITKPFEDDYLLERVRRIFDHLALREHGRFEMEVALRIGERTITLSADKGQIMELLIANFEELCRLARRLEESQRAVEEHARTLEARVQERTQQLLQSEKLAVMGELLAGVAHELNNPLSVVTGQTALLRQAVGEGPLTARADKIAQAAGRCARIVRNFLALARQRPPERQAVQLNQVVKEAVELLAYQLRVENVEVNFALAGDVPRLWADPHQLQQVVINLVTNAQQAMRGMPPPRRLSLATRHDPAHARVCLEVADTGPGIPPEIRSRIFEPFFTTKPLGQGTGLGLSLCQGIVESHGGSMRAETPAGQGAVFLVELPVATRPLAEAETRPGEARAPIRDKTILVVDDEPEIANLLAEMLSADGHQVETAANGAIALSKLRERTYDLILSDIRMPELDGPGFYREVERRHPQLLSRFVFITGDTLSPETTELMERTETPSLNKPFALEEVRRVLQRVLRTP